MALSMKPLSDRVVIEPLEDETDQSPGGIYIPDTAKEKPQKGTVIAVGPGRISDEGTLVEMTIKAGQTIIYSKYAGTEYSENGTDYLIVRESDVLATVS